MKPAPAPAKARSSRFRPAHREPALQSRRRGTLRPPPDSPHDYQAMLTSAQRLAGLGSWTWDLRTDRLVWSEETRRLMQVAPEDFGSCFDGFIQFVHPDDRDRLHESAAAALAGETPEFAYRYRLLRPDGAVRLIAGDGEVQFGPDGLPRRLVGTVMDITERERDRRDTQETRARLSGLLGLSTDWYWEQDDQFRFTAFWGGRKATMGKRPEMIGKCRWELPCVPLAGGWDEHRELLEARRRFLDVEYRLEDGDSVRYISVSGEPFYGADGSFKGYRGTATDITDRKRFEERLRQSNTALKMAMRLGRIGAWRMELPCGAIDWVGGGRQLFRVDGGVVTRLDDLLERTEPAQRAELAAAFDACIRHGQRFDLEVQLVAGAYPALWVRLIGESFPAGDGHARGLQGTVQDITERKLAAERVRDIGTRLADTLDTLPECFVTFNRQWCFSYVNQEAERSLRRTRGRLLGRNVWEVFPMLAGTVFEEQCRRAAAGSQAVEFDGFFEALQQWLHVKAIPSPQGLALYFRDITDTHGVRDALAVSLEQFRHLFESTIDGVVYTTGSGRIVRANAAASAMLRRTPLELCGHDLASLVAGDDPRLAALLEQRAVTGRASGQLTFQAGDGSRFEAEVGTAEYDGATGPAAFLVLRDITQRLQAEREIRELNEDLGERVRLRTAELESANAELKVFARSLAHDLRSPIAAVHGFSEMLERTLPVPLPERTAHYLGRIRAAATKMDLFTEGLLSLARVSQAELRLEDVNLSQLVAEALAHLQERDRSRKVICTVQPGVVVRGDPTLLRMALENLVGNAWKFTGKREVAEIDFAAQPAAEGLLECRVRDNGAGFDMAYAGKLFDSFQRLHSEREFPGTGIGLANVQRIIARHGGTVGAQGEEDRGACFRFTVPAALPA